jgi:hypothetical protein
VGVLISRQKLQTDNIKQGMAATPKAAPPTPTNLTSLTKALRSVRIKMGMNIM